MIRCSSRSIEGVRRRLAIGGEPAVDLVLRPLGRVLAALAQPGLAVVAVDDRARQVELLGPVGHRVVGHDQVLVGHELVDQRRDRQVVERPDVPHEAQRLAAHLVVEDELRQAEDQQEVEHPGAAHAVDAGERGEQAEPNVSAPAWASRILPSDSAMYDWHGSPRCFATATYATSSWSASIAAIGDDAIFMWNVAGAPPNRTGRRAGRSGPS